MKSSTNASDRAWMRRSVEESFHRVKDPIGGSLDGQKEYAKRRGRIEVETAGVHSEQ